MSETVEEYYASLEPVKCRGCECSGLVYSEPRLGLHWECELVATGEPCYMGDESYNQDYRPLEETMNE